MWRKNVFTYFYAHLRNRSLLWSVGSIWDGSSEINLDTLSILVSFSPVDCNKKNSLLPERTQNCVERDVLCDNAGDVPLFEGNIALESRSVFETPMFDDYEARKVAFSTLNEASHTWEPVDDPPYVVPVPLEGTPSLVQNTCYIKQGLAGNKFSRLEILGMSNGCVCAMPDPPTQYRSFYEIRESLGPWGP